MENPSTPAIQPAPAPEQPVTPKAPFPRSLNKWALASLLTFLLGGALLFVIGIVYTMAMFSTGSSPDQLFWIVIAIFIIPAGVLFRFIGLVAIVSLALAIISLVQSHGKKNVLAIVMVVVSAIFALLLPRVFIGF